MNGKTLQHQPTAFYEDGRLSFAWILCKDHKKFAVLPRTEPSMLKVIVSDSTVYEANSRL